MTVVMYVIWFFQLSDYMSQTAYKKLLFTIRVTTHTNFILKQNTIHVKTRERWFPYTTIKNYRNIQVKDSFIIDMYESLRLKLFNIIVTNINWKYNFEQSCKILQLIIHIGNCVIH